MAAITLCLLLVMLPLMRLQAQTEESEFSWIGVEAGLDHGVSVNENAEESGAEEANPGNSTPESLEDEGPISGESATERSGVETQSGSGTVASGEHPRLIIHWLGTGAPAGQVVTHVDQNPLTDDNWSYLMGIDFTPRSTNVYPPGEIEIRIPIHHVQLRDGSNLPADAHGFVHQIPTTVAGDTANNGFLFHGVIDGYIVLRNHRDFQGNERFAADLSFWYRPNLVEDGSDWDVVGDVRLGSENPREPSNTATMNHTSRVVPVDPVKNVRALHSSWHSAWGNEPADSQNYFFVEYTLRTGHTVATTQPFQVVMTERPGYYNGVRDGEMGVIIAWTTQYTQTDQPAHLSPAGAWRPEGTGIGSTEAFNASVQAAWDRPPSNLSLGNQNRWVRIIVKYPRTGEPNQRVTNTMDVVYTGIDGGEIRQTVSASTVFNEVGFVYEGDYFGIAKHMPGTSGLVYAVHHLEMGRNILINGTGGSTGTPRLAVTSRGLGLAGAQLVPGGEGEPDTWVVPGGDIANLRPFVTQVIDDYMYLEVGGAFHELHPEDYRFIAVRITALEERVPVLDQEGRVVGMEVVPNQARSPVRIYARETENHPWIHITTSVPVGTTQAYALVNFANLGFTQDFSNVKAVHSNGIGEVRMTVGLSIELRPTPRVLDMLGGTTGTVRWHNFANLQIFEEGQERIPGTQVNQVGPESYTGNFGPVIRDRDLNPDGPYGALLQRATHDSTLGRPPLGVTATKGRTSIISDGANGREIFSYVLTGGQNVGTTTDLALIDELVEGLGLEIREGVFFDLLPRGTVLDVTSIQVRDAGSPTLWTPDPSDIILHHNWRGSGQTLLEVRVQARSALNAGRITTGGASFSGSGFQLLLQVFYPWENIGHFGQSVRNIAAFQSRSGPLHSAALTSTGQNRPDDGNWGTFTSAERALMAHLARDASGVTLPPHERNTLYMMNTGTVYYLPVRNIGLTKLVRGGHETTYGVHTVVDPGEVYVYRLRFQNAAENFVTDLILFDVLEASHGGQPHWRGTLESVHVTPPINSDAAPVIWYSTESGLDPVNNLAHATLAEPRWTTIKPTDARTITAIAVDLTTNQVGGSFVIGEFQSVLVQIYMRAGAFHPTLAHNSAAYWATKTAMHGEASPERGVLETKTVTVALREPENLQFAIHKADQAFYERKNNGEIRWADVNEYFLLTGGQFSLFHWSNISSSPDPPNEWVGTGNVGPPDGPWLLVGDGASTGDVNAPIVFHLSVRYRYFQLVETRSPIGFELPLVQWRLVLEHGSRRGDPINAHLTHWEEIGDDWWVSIVPIGEDGGRTPAFVRQPVLEDPEEGAGEWYIGNHLKAESQLPYTGGRGKLILLVVALVAMMVAGVALFIQWDRNRRSRIRFECEKSVRAMLLEIQEESQ